MNLTSVLTCLKMFCDVCNSINIQKRAATHPIFYFMKQLAMSAIKAWLQSNRIRALRSQKKDQFFLSKSQPICLQCIQPTMSFPKLSQSWRCRGTLQDHLANCTKKLLRTNSRKCKVFLFKVKRRVIVFQWRTWVDAEQLSRLIRTAFVCAYDQTDQTDFLWQCTYQS